MFESPEARKSYGVLCRGVEEQILAERARVEHPIADATQIVDQIIYREGNTTTTILRADPTSGVPRDYAHSKEFRASPHSPLLRDETITPPLVFAMLRNGWIVNRRPILGHEEFPSSLLVVAKKVEMEEIDPDFEEWVNTYNHMDHYDGRVRHALSFVGQPAQVYGSLDILLTRVGVEFSASPAAIEGQPAPNPKLQSLFSAINVQPAFAARLALDFARTARLLQSAA